MCSVLRVVLSSPEAPEEEEARSGSEEPAPGLGDGMQLRSAAATRRQEKWSSARKRRNARNRPSDVLANRDV
jgi:hypothetical protein